ncbi:MAG TPA: pilus assembly protein [Lachnospiraceae bacterium]|jgi:pilus assembly protein CpaF|nr:pilus assembly protein [Lachnospiraceae bacterium]
MDTIKEKLQQMVLEGLDLRKDISDEELYASIDHVLIGNSRENYIGMKEKRLLRREIFNSIRGLDVLQDLIEDPLVTEIMVNGTDKIFIEKNGTICCSDKSFASKQKLENIIQQIVAQSNRIINEANPIVDARLADGSRVNIVLPPIAIDGATVTIRKFPNNPITIEQLLEYESITEEAAEVLHKLVIAGYNIFISGGTGSGKTTFLNVLSNYIPQSERIITIEDSAELQIRNIPNLVRMEVRNANTEGLKGITIRDLIKTALRMRPDRIIIGEVRDGAAFDMLQAFNTGHDGSLSTGHANSPADMLSRLESLVLMGADIPLLAVRKQIASAIDIIVHLGRLRDRSRRVLEITEVLGCVDGEIPLNPLYTFIESGEKEGRVTGCLQKRNNLVHTEKLKNAGLPLHT